MKAIAKLTGVKAGAANVKSLESKATTGNSAIEIDNTDNSFQIKLNAGTAKKYTISDSRINKSDGSLIKSLPATNDYNVPDSVIKESNGTVIANVKATDAYNVPDALVTNSDNSYIASLRATEHLVLPDISFTDSDGRIYTVPGQKNIVATLSPTLQQLINAASAAVLYADLGLALKLAGVIGLLTTSDLGNLSGAQVNAFIQSLSASTIYADLTGAQKAAIIPDFSAAEIDANITTGQVTGLGATNVQKLVIAQINNLVNAQLLMLNNTQLVYVLNNAMSAQFINDNLSQGTRNKLNQIYMTQTGQTTSRATGDDGATQRGRLTAFSTLPLNNVFGNTRRFTDYAGNLASTGNYVIDHATGLGWNNVFRSGSSPFTLAAYMGFVSTLNSGGGITVNGVTYTDWFFPNINELWGIALKDSPNCLNYSPMGLDIVSNGNEIMSSTSQGSATSVYHLQQQGQAFLKNPTVDGAKYIIARKHF